jgi:hypothetical protein
MIVADSWGTRSLCRRVESILDFGFLIFACFVIFDFLIGDWLLPGIGDLEHLRLAISDWLIAWSEAAVSARARPAAAS